MISTLENIADAIRGLLHIIEEHGTPVQMAHGQFISNGRKALFDIERILASMRFLFSDILLDKESKEE